MLLKWKNKVPENLALLTPKNSNSKQIMEIYALNLFYLQEYIVV